MKNTIWIVVTVLALGAYFAEAQAQRVCNTYPVPGGGYRTVCN
jgi:hypothetical protein